MTHGPSGYGSRRRRGLPPPGGPTTGRQPPGAELRGITKRFGAVQALSEVDFDAYAGEVVALVGDNGAGKSTLVKTIAGVDPPDGGQVFFAGPRRCRSASPRTPRRTLASRRSIQDLALCDNLDVVANLFLGNETGAGREVG